MIYSWFISTRFLSIFFLASFIIIGYGLENIIRFLHEGRKLSKSIVAAGLVIYIVGFGVGRNVRPYYEERADFRQAGEIIEKHLEPNTVEKMIATRSKAASYAFFYAHRHVTRPACIESEIIPIPSSYGRIIESMVQQGIRFFLYEAKYWPHAQYDFLSRSYADDFDVLGQWDSKANGLIMLLKLKSASS